MASTRRKFMQDSSAVLSTGVLATQLGRSAQAASRPKTRVGIIGSTGRGSYGHAVDLAFTQIPQVEIVALADDHDEGRELAQKRTQAKRAYADYREMLSREQLDVVAICPRWVDQHRDMLLAAAEAGCHVYMEKPFCATLAECDEVIDALGKRNLKLGIAHLSQYSPTLEVVQALIAAGAIGEVLELRARGKEDHRGGGEDLWVLGSHMFGLMRSLAGGNASSCLASVTAQGRAISKQDVKAGAEGLGLLAGDSVHAEYAFPSGVRGYFASRRGMEGKPTRFAIQVFGSQGIIEMESGYLAPTHILRDGGWSPGRSGKSWEPISSAGIGKPEPRTDGTYQGGHIAAILDLIDCIEQDRPAQCTPEDCRQIVQMIAAVFESQRVGGPVEFPMLTRVNPLSLMT